MSNTRYRRGKLYAADMAVYTRQMAADNSAELSRLKRNLIRALKEDVTPRQREVLTLYYAQGLNMREIGWGWTSPRCPGTSSGGSGGSSAACAMGRKHFCATCMTEDCGPWRAVVR